MPGSSTRTKTRSRDSILFNRIAKLSFEKIASVPVPTVASTVLDAITLPCSCKILGAAVHYSSIGSTLGTFKFNIVAGTGTYETTSGSYASDTVTMGGTVHTGDLITFTFSIPNALLQANGVPTTYCGTLGQVPDPNKTVIQFMYTVKSTDTTTSILATSILQTFNGGAFNVMHLNGLQSTYLGDIMYGGSIAGPVITFNCLRPGTLQNSITLVSSVTGPGATTTATVGALNFANGVANTGVTLAQNDQYEYNGQYVFAPAGSGTLAATPIFQGDMPMFTPSVGNSVYWSTNWDAVYQQGSIMTLRAITPTGAPLVDFKAKLLFTPFDVAELPNPTFSAFDPHLVIW